jgi:hypothetical protein
MQIEYIQLLHQKDSDTHKVSLQNIKHFFKSIFPPEVIYVDHSPNFKKTLFKQIDLFYIYLFATTLFCMKTNDLISFTEDLC